MAVALITIVSSDGISRYQALDEQNSFWTRPIDRVDHEFRYEVSPASLPQTYTDDTWGTALPFPAPRAGLRWLAAREVSGGVHSLYTRVMNEFESFMRFTGSGTQATLTYDGAPVVLVGRSVGSFTDVGTVATPTPFERMSGWRRVRSVMVTGSSRSSATVEALRPSLIAAWDAANAAIGTANPDLSRLSLEDADEIAAYQEIAAEYYFATEAWVQSWVDSLSPSGDGGGLIDPDPP